MRDCGVDKLNVIKVDYKKLTDYELIQGCLDGDNSYFNELLGRYKNLVYSVVLRMVNDREEANDLAQEVFIKLYKNLARYQPEYKFSTWVIKIVTNHVIDYRRRKKQEFVDIDDIGSKIPGRPQDNPEYAFEMKELSKLLKNLLEDLPEMYRVPIVLYHQQGLSYQEISDITNEPLSKIKNRIFRGRKMLKESLQGLKKGVIESYV